MDAETRAIFKGDTSTCAWPYPACGKVACSAAVVWGRATSIWNIEAASKTGRGPIRSASWAK